MTQAANQPQSGTAESNSKRALIIALSIIGVIVVILLAARFGFQSWSSVNPNKRYIEIAQELVSDELKCPSTAKYPDNEDDYSFDIDADCDYENDYGDEYNTCVKVTGYVDSDNSYGASIRMTFEAEFYYDSLSDEYEEIGVSVDDKVNTYDY